MEGTELNNLNIMEPCCEDLSPISFDNRLLKFNYRLTAETNERVLVTRQRALHDTDFDTHNAGEAMLTQLAKRVDDPLADPEVLAAISWLMRLETRDPGLRLLAINRRVLSSIGLFYRDTGGVTWDPLKWPAIDSKTGEKTLRGIEVTPVGTVVRLKLPENNLVGVVPRDFTKSVQYLKELDLHGNPGLGGALPGTIGNLSLCARLDLSFCGFEGPLPPQLSLMLNLEELNLNNCGFTGDLNPRLVDCSKLQRLNLSNNQFVGELPRSWGRLKRLRTLLVKNNCNIRGSIPDEWAELYSLEEIDVRNNKLAGEVPRAILSLLQPSSESGNGARGEGTANGSVRHEEEGGIQVSSSTRLKVIRLRGNNWSAKIQRWPDGILLNRCTDLGLVDLPGTPFMTSRDAARRLIHCVVTSGDVGVADESTVTGGAASLLNRRHRPPTAQSPRVVARSTNRYEVKVGGEKVTAGLAALQLVPARVPCEACKGLYPVCMCISVCGGCGNFNRLSRMREARPGGSGGGEGGACRWCGLSEGNAVKYRAAVTAHSRAAVSKKVDRKFSPGAATSASRSRNARTLGQALLYPPKPLDLLCPPISQAMDANDPYADNFPF